MLDAVGAKYDTAFSCTEALLGGCAIDATGTALPDETLRAAEASDAVLLAAVGGPKWDTTDPAKPRPEQGLLGIRKALGLYTNLRPVQIFAALADASTLKPDVYKRQASGSMSIVEQGIPCDIVLVLDQSGSCLLYTSRCV